MNCIDNVTLPFSATINVPEGFFYNDENQLSVAVSTDDLNIYVVEESFITDDIVNPCTQTTVEGIKVYINEIRMSGTLMYRMALNALVSSYNFILGNQPNVNNDGWSSTDGMVQIKLVDQGETKDYIILGYEDVQNPKSIPTNEDISVVLESYDVIKHTIGNETILELTGEFSFIVNRA